MNILFFDTETTGFVRKGELIQPGQARCVQLGALLVEWDPQEPSVETEHGRVNEIIKPEGFTIPEQVAQIHGISQERALAEGKPSKDVYGAFQPLVDAADVIVAHNFSYDNSIMEIEQAYGNVKWVVKSSFCTMRESTDLCAIPKKAGWGGYKWPKLQEAHKHFFGEYFEEAHSAFADLLATKRVYFELMRLRTQG